MAQLPKIQPGQSLTVGARSRVTAADIANPYQQIAGVLGDAAEIVRAKELDDMQTEGENAVFRSPDGILQVKTKSNWSVLGRTYNRAAMHGYMARLSGDVRAKGADLASGAKGDPAAFANSWKGFQDEILKAAPRESRGAVKTLLESEGARFGLGVSETKRSHDLKVFEGNIKAEVAALDDEMSALAQKDGTGTAAYRERQSQIRSLIGEMAGNPDFALGDKEADLAVRRMESRHMGYALVGKVESTLAGQGVAAARKMAEDVLTDTNLDMSPSERRLFSAMMDERINGALAVRKAELEPIREQAKAIKERLKLGVGLDANDVDETARALARGGDAAGAWELSSARASARALSRFRNLSSKDQAAALEQANGGARAAGAGHPMSVAPDLQGRMKQASGHYLKRGLSPVIASGIIGNLVQESNLNAGALNAGDGSDGSDSVGLGQWNGDRARALKAFAAKQGKPASDFETQLDFVLHELQTTEKATWDQLKNAKTVDEATAIMIGYERPQGWTAENPRGGHGWSNRRAMAVKAAQLAGVADGSIGSAISEINVDFSGIDLDLVKEMQAEVTADAKDLFGDMKDGFVRSNAPAPEEVALLTRQLSMIDDEDLRAEVRTFFESKEAADSIAQMPEPARDALLSALNAEGGSGLAVAQQEMLGAMERTHAAIREQVATDPIGFAADRKMTAVPQPLDFSNPAQMAAGFGERQRAADVLAASGTADGVSALRPSDLKAMRSFLDAATPQEQAAVLGVMGKTLKPRTLEATAAALAGKDGGSGMAAAASLYADNPDAAEGVLRGYALLKANPKLAPKDDDTFKIAQSEYIPMSGFGVGFEPARQSLLNASRARYADLSAQTGDESQVLVEARWQQAVWDVTGGFVDHGGEKIIAPVYGMGQGDFDALLAKSGQQLTGAVTEEGAPIPLQTVIGEGKLKAIGPGEYLIEFGAGTYARLKADRMEDDGGFVPFVLDLRAR